MEATRGRVGRYSGFCAKYFIDNILGFLYTFFMSPTIFRAGNYRVEEHKSKIVKAWKKHFEA